MDIAEFEKMIRHELPIWRMAALRILGSSTEIDDVIQSALLHYWEHRQKNTVAKPEAYITICVVHEAYKLVNKRKRDTSKIHEFTIMQHANNGDSDIEMIRSAIAKLPEIYRDTLQIAVLEERHSPDAAAILGCSVNTLYQRIHKAKQLLKEILETQS